VILTKRRICWAAILKLVEGKTAAAEFRKYALGTPRHCWQYELPAEMKIVLSTFTTGFKSVSRGLRFPPRTITCRGNWTSPMAKLDIMVAGEPVDALSTINPSRFSAYGPRAVAGRRKMKELIPPRMV